jgi:hypothetical protein
VKRVDKSEILDLGAYEQIRDRFRARIIAEKQSRRVALGDHMSVLFENHDTVLFQIQEMLRTERINAEPAVLHEIETYNELVPGDNELSATIFVEYDDRAEREKMLVALAGVDDKFYVIAGGERSAVTPDRRNTEPGRTIAVHYVKFSLTFAQVQAIVRLEPVQIGVDHPAYRAEVTLPASVTKSLAADLSTP